MKEERLTLAAIKLKDGRIFTGECHGYAMMNAEEAGVKEEAIDAAIDGFMTNRGRFLNRDESSIEFGIWEAMGLPWELN